MQNSSNNNLLIIDTSILAQIPRRAQSTVDKPGGLYEAKIEPVEHDFVWIVEHVAHQLVVHIEPI